ncbi:MAG: M50 family metallopeptidase [Minicystis sp.]
MRFRLLGIPITIRGWFWITAVLFSLGNTEAVGLWGAPIWVLAMLVSILVHEMGHALAVRRHGIAPAITLHAMGGTTTSNDARLGRLDRALIDLAGPVAGLVLGGLVYLGGRSLPPGMPVPLTFALGVLFVMNVFWSVLNLMPVLPLDGGHIMENALGPQRARTTHQLSLGFAVVLAGLAAWMHHPMIALLFVVWAIQAYQRLTMAPGAVLIDPLTAPAGSAGDGPGPLRRWWLKRKLARLQAESAALRNEKPRRRTSGPHLEVIEGGRATPPKDKRYLN